MRTKRRRTRAARPLDSQEFSEAFQGNESLYVSYGIVTPNQVPEDVVLFDEDEGMPMVRVMLEPGKIPVLARVASHNAGNGEGEWHPFVSGDEVLCVIPSGDPRVGVCIVGRLNNQLDRFPFDGVAGQKASSNTFAFRRRRTPYVEELAGPWIVRQATTGALISLDTTGTVTLRDGQGAAFQLSPDAVGLQGPSSETSPPRFLLQADLTGERFVMQFGSALFAMGSELASDGGKAYLTSPGAFTVALGANAPMEHVATVEFVIAAIVTACKAITVVGGGDPVTGGAPAAALRALVALGGPPLDLLSVAALASGLPLAALQTKGQGLGGVQTAPGLGAVNFLTG